MDEGLKHFPTRDLKMANKCIKRCSTSLTKWVIQMKVTVSYHPYTRLAIIKKTRDNKCWHGDGEKGFMYALGRI